MRPPRRRRRARRVAAALLLVIALLAIAAVVLLAPGTYETYPRSALLTTAGRRAAPDWTRPCWARARKLREPTCAHVSGRVVWIQREDPDGDGDRHLVVAGELRLRVVKIPKTLPVSRLPGYGKRIDAVGYLALGSSGHPEVIAARLVPGGPSGR